MPSLYLQNADMDLWHGWVGLVFGTLNDEANEPKLEVTCGLLVEVIESSSRTGWDETTQTKRSRTLPFLRWSPNFVETQVIRRKLSCLPNLRRRV